MASRNVLGILLALWLTGCGLLGGLQVEAVSTSAQKPSNVALYLSVTDKDGTVPKLTADHFKIYEDGQLVPASQTSQTLLERSVAAAHYTVLLLDMSGSPDDATRRAVSRGTIAFLKAVTPMQGVAVFAFDGGTKVHRLADFEQGAAAVESVPALDNFKPTDPSSNLNGAVLEALSELDASLLAIRKPIRIGTLVVLARGPDLAKRVTPEKMREARDHSGHQVLAVGVGEDTGDLRLDDVGPDGVSRADTVAGLEAAFRDAAAQVVAYDSSHYLLSYCSPARSGKRQLEVEVVLTDAEGNERSASAYAEFDATGFAAGCDPSTPPKFVAAQLDDEEEESDEEGGDEESDNGSAPQKPAKPRPRSPSSPSQPKPDAPEDDEVVPPPSKPGYAPE